MKTHHHYRGRGIRSIVLDLDNTLICTQDKPSHLKDLKIGRSKESVKLRRRIFVSKLEDAEGIRGLGDRYDYWSVKRPHLEEFLNFCFDYFPLVIVWSAGTEGYVRDVINNIFPPGKRPHYIFARKFCVKTDEGRLGKPLQKLFDHDQILNKLSYRDTIHLDDTSHTFTEFNPDNGLLIPPYDVDPTVESILKDDCALLDVIEWLKRKEVLNCSDVRQLDKTKIFPNNDDIDGNNDNENIDRKGE